MTPDDAHRPSGRATRLPQGGCECGVSPTSKPRAPPNAESVSVSIRDEPSISDGPSGHSEADPAERGRGGYCSVEVQHEACVSVVGPGEPWAARDQLREEVLQSPPTG